MKKVTASDAHDLANIDMEVGGWSASQIRDHLKFGHGLMVGRGKDVLGFILYTSNKFETFIYRVIVAREHRGNGIGKDLATTVMAAKPQCIVSISERETEAAMFFAKCGLMAKFEPGAEEDGLYVFTNPSGKSELNPA